MKLSDRDSLSVSSALRTLEHVLKSASEISDFLSVELPAEILPEYAISELSLLPYKVDAIRSLLLNLSSSLTDLYASTRASYLFPSPPPPPPSSTSFPSPSSPSSPFSPETDTTFSKS